MKTYEYNKSQEMLMRASKVVPCGVYGHLGPAEGCFIPVGAFPKFMSRAEGAYYWDLDGNRFIDYMCAYGPNILGYNDIDVDNAVRAQMKIGNCTTSPSVKLVELAELMVDTVASADWAFFAKNGGDVTTLAIMTARASTGRKKIVFIQGYYHGVAPWTQKADCPGVLEEDVANNLMMPWNDVPAFEKIVSENKGQIACLIATPYMHGNFVDNVLPAENYWKQIRDICTRNGIVLIFDDVRCGFRLDLAGSDHYFGIKADLICFCKAIANGWNVSCLCGSDAMRGAVSSITYTGSYWLSAVPFAAGIACITKLRELKADVALREKGIYLTNGLKEVAKNNGVKLVVSGAPSLFYMRLAEDDSLLMHQEWIAECVKRGVFLTNHHNHFTNMAMTKEDFDFTFEVADEALKTVIKNRRN